MSTGSKKVKKGLKAGPRAMKLTAPPIPANVEKKPGELIKLACKLSMSSGSFVDTKFYAYSKRSPSGTVHKPQSIYANSFLLRAKAPQYFEPLLQGGYDGYCLDGSLQAAFPAEFPSEADGCGYDSDSDIEDEDPKVEEGIFSSSSESWDTLGGPSSIVPVDDTGTKDEKASDSKATDATVDNKDGNDLPDSGPQGKVRLMRDFAYPTWNSFIYYLYTGDVAFAPLKSQTQTPEPSDAARRDGLTAAAPRCSPKSMYRLADELGLDDLKQLAKTDIESKLSADNILAELFSSFTANYDAIRDMELDFACNQAKSAVTQGIFEWMQNIPANDLKRNAGVIAHLVRKLAGGATSSNSNPNYCNHCRTNRTFNCSYCGQAR